MQVIYPFTAIVGQERMRRALVLNAIYPKIGGVLIRGERGTAKSTAARALAALLPQVKAIKDCRFGCNPYDRSTWCTECRERFKNGAKIPVITRPTPFINLPVSATEDRVVGTLDIEKAIQKESAILNPASWLLPIVAFFILMRSIYWTTMLWISCWILQRWA